MLLNNPYPKKQPQFLRINLNKNHFILYPFLLSWLILGLFMTGSPAFANDYTYKITYPNKLQQRLVSELKHKGVTYKARTKHINNGSPLYTNRLIFEDSPYLIQHAHNPVNWYPWGEEAFATAKLENKPIFLSIGYATCHWCHVMEEESFENIQVAKLLNENFIAIKVDREQYPDIDATYMEAVQLLTGRGGWPMSSFITSDGKPFFSGTYYPQATFVDLLQQITRAWTQQKPDLLKQADQIAVTIQKNISRQGVVTKLEQSIVQASVQEILKRAAIQSSGFSAAPKFPQEPFLLSLLQSAERKHQPALLKSIDNTLSAMAQGGIYDQIGGGFHRYSTDDNWLVPHFEKMLYNQAYLARIYTQAYRLTNNPLYARVAKQTLNYVLRDMRSNTGVFYSATDADSEGEEGTYFIWTIDEIKNVLKPDDAKFIIQLFGLTSRGNFENKNILFLKEPLTQAAKKQGLSLDKMFAKLNPLLEDLRKYRQQRTPPLTDNKVIVAWNGMLITALLEASDILHTPRYLEAAKTAVESLWKLQRPRAGELWRINLNNQASIAAKQDDYAHFSEALIKLYDLTALPSYLQMAESLSNEMVDKFLDTASSTLLMGTDKLLFTQAKDSYDSTLPSGNSVAVRIFYQLFNRTGKQIYKDYATNILASFSSNISQQPILYPYMLAQLDELKKGEISGHLYAAHSAIKIDATTEKITATKFKLMIDFKIKPGWHINAHQPIQEQLIATTIKVTDGNHWQLSEIQYPSYELVKTNIDAEPLALYQGEFRISANLMKKITIETSPLKIELNLQACNQKTCLAPELITLFLSPAR